MEAEMERLRQVWRWMAKDEQEERCLLPYRPFAAVDGCRSLDEEVDEIEERERRMAEEREGAPAPSAQGDGFEF